MSTNCDDCIERNPVIPVYTKAKPVGDACGGCGGSGNILFPPSGGGGGTGKTTEVIPGFSIGVDDLSDSLVDRFRVNWVQAIQLTAALVLTAKSGGASKSNPVLWGTIIDEINLTWSYNREPDVNTQTLVSAPALTDPTLGSSERDYDYTALTLKNSNTTITITGNDNLGLPESIGADSKSITFGNYLIHGVGVSLENSTTASLISFIEGLLPAGGTIATNRTTNFFAESVVLERDFFAIPKRFGFGTFSKNGGNGNGGFKRMKDVAGTLVAAVDQFAVDGDETDIPINNGVEAEDYLIYMSVYDNIADILNPITIT